MKKYLFLFALIFTSYSYSFQITGESFKAKFKIDSITVGKSESTINLSSADVGQYGVVYVSYTRHLTQIFQIRVPGQVMGEV